MAQFKPVTARFEAKKAYSKNMKILVTQNQQLWQRLMKWKYYCQHHGIVCQGRITALVTAGLEKPHKI
jgi:uncharacterized protein YqiB (DUF1249 family)